MRYVVGESRVLALVFVSTLLFCNELRKIVTKEKSFMIGDDTDVRAWCQPGP